MSKIKVVATQGLRVPLADNPHEYIDDNTPVEVDQDDVYYRRLLAEGDLMIWQEAMPSEKKGK